MFEIGTSLREARLRQGLEFPQAEQATKIRGKYLRALEDEQFAVLPSQTYVKGFLRSYAEYLGLDGQLYVDEFNSRYVVGEEEAPLRPRRSSAGRSDRRLQSNVVLFALVGIGVVTALVIAAWKFGGSSPQRTPVSNLGNAPKIDTRALRPAATPTRPRRRRPTAAHLLITAQRGPSWIEVHAASATGRSLYQGTLDLGKSLPLSARRLWINVGIPENLNVKLNGRAVHFPGGGPQVVVVTANGISRAPTA